jgi:hypothetical protein
VYQACQAAAMEKERKCATGCSCKRTDTVSKCPGVVAKQVNTSYPRGKMDICNKNIQKCNHQQSAKFRPSTCIIIITPLEYYLGKL